MFKNSFRWKGVIFGVFWVKIWIFWHEKPLFLGWLPFYRLGWVDLYKLSKLTFWTKIGYLTQCVCNVTFHSEGLCDYTFSLWLKDKWKMALPSGNLIKIFYTFFPCLLVIAMTLLWVLCGRKLDFQGGKDNDDFHEPWFHN